MYEIVVPVYNGADTIRASLESNSAHVQRMTLVDDASTDGTLGEIERFSSNSPPGPKLLRMAVNGRKVGAVKKAVNGLPQDIDYVVTTDDDTRIVSAPEDLEWACGRMEEKGYAAAAFRMNVANPGGVFGSMQSLEYKMANGFRRLLGGRQMITPGAGSIYRRSVLEDALDDHSGEYLGDDMELTIKIQKDGYKAGFIPEIEVRTVAPRTLGQHSRQRAGWERGCQRVLAKEAPYIARNMLRPNGLSAASWLAVSSHITIPLGIYDICDSAIRGDPSALNKAASWAVTSGAVVAGLAAASGDKLGTRDVLAAPLMPAYMLYTTLASRINAYSNGLPEAAGEIVSLIVPRTESTEA
ncbi:MAG: glycosyltransferase family 2 protein [Candidatus Aenigmatarchaeota archaeon]|nr:MAG: glycosyltransferase family 2 protein [Candidatus Aenigmarchaeota archaeon]